MAKGYGLHSKEHIISTVNTNPVIVLCIKFFNTLMFDHYSNMLKIPHQASTRKTYRFLGPWAPITRVFSISAVLLGPVMNVIIEGNAF